MKVKTGSRRILILLIAIGFILQGCAKNSQLLRNGIPQPELITANYRFPDFKKSEHTPPDSVVAFIAGKIKHKSRFHRDAHGNIIKTIKYDPSNRIPRTTTLRKVVIDTLPTMEVRKTINSSGEIKEIIASSIRMPENILVIEKYSGSGKFEERIYGVLGPNNLLMSIKMDKEEGLDSVTYEYNGNIGSWDYQHRNGKIVAKIKHLMRDELKLLKSIAYSCKNDNCKESGVLEQYYVDINE